jgi:uncharacterized membrane protein YeaQ/YmgE (transglycosylase-associated protein family)
MVGILTWLACGVIAGLFVSRLISGHDKSLVLLTIGVGITGAIVGGFGAALFGFGTIATFNILGLVFAVLGATVALVGYRRAIDA